jgi:hypothetical protein|tara:strand:+ start:18571 stop:19173 length:603 start_codon:yes stop_codon:yes gene_type:complete
MKAIIKPYLFEIPLPQLKDCERIITKHAVDQFNLKESKSAGRGYNVHLDNIPELDKLWRIFVRLCDSSFYNLSPVNEDVKEGECWAYVQNKDRNVSQWHSHVTTASINGVYYPNVPDYTGTLSVLTSFAEEKEVQVKQGHLYLFPGWMIHKPNPQMFSEEPRVSINVELLTYTRPILHKFILDVENTSNSTHSSYHEVMW